MSFTRGQFLFVVEGGLNRAWSLDLAINRMVFICIGHQVLEWKKLSELKKHQYQLPLNWDKKSFVKSNQIDKKWWLCLNQFKIPKASPSFLNLHCSLKTSHLTTKAASISFTLMWEVWKFEKKEVEVEEAGSQVSCKFLGDSPWPNSRQNWYCSFPLHPWCLSLMCLNAIVKLCVLLVFNSWWKHMSSCLICLKMDAGFLISVLLTWWHVWCL